MPLWLYWALLGLIAGSLAKFLLPGRDPSGCIFTILLGLIAGAIAKALMPGRDPGGFIVTILIGIVGAFLGGFLGNMIAGPGLNGFSLWSILLAVLGSMLLLWIYRLATRPRRTM